MNVFELLKIGKAELEADNVDDFEFDAFCLIEKTFGFNKNEYFLKRFEEVNDDKQKEYLSYIKRRISGEPLQYILGKWEFMNGEFYVGSGVLIPRQDTEILVETAAEFIKSHANVKNVYDLCSGSGCIGISLAMMFPDIQVTCVELSEIAFSYLQKNIELNNVKNVRALKADITNGFELLSNESIDVLVSNPPYIESDEIFTLSREVQNEPIMALDGGKDGFYFYNIIKDKWLKFLKPNSFACFECGETQADILAELYSPISSEVNIHNDLNGIKRVVSVIKN